MRIIHSNQFTPKERIDYQNTIASNIATTLFTLLDQADWSRGSTGSTNQSEHKQSPEFHKALQVFCFSQKCAIVFYT